MKIFCMMVTAIILLSQTLIIAQSETGFQSKKEKIETQKVAFITTKLNLTTDESKNFWPVYNEYETKQEATREEFKKNYKITSADSLTEEQANKLLTAQSQMEQDLLNLKFEYITKFLAVLPAVKVVKLVESEKAFKKALLKMLKEMPKKPLK